MKIVIMSANLGGIDVLKQSHVQQNIPPDWGLEYKYFNDLNVVPRPMSFHPRVQCKIFKMCGFNYVENADLIIWLDGSWLITSPNFVTWMVEKLGSKDLCLMPHDNRKSIVSEAKFIVDEISKGNQYLKVRYGGEPFDNQITDYFKDKTFKDNCLAATGCFIYKPTDKIKEAFKDWLLENIIHTNMDQVSLPYILHKHNIDSAWLDCGVANCPYMRFSGHIK